MISTIATDWIAVTATIIGVLLTSLVALIAYLLKTFINEIKDDIIVNGDRIATFQRHQDSMIHSIWQLLWRQDNVEEYLKDESSKQETFATKFRVPPHFPPINNPVEPK